MTSGKPILVTGSHRSGTTWVGIMIAEAPSVFYIFEPFNISYPRPGICNAEFKYWFTYITRENESDFYRPIKNTIELKYDLVGALKSIKSVRDLRNVQKEYMSFLKHRLKGSRPIVKDPMAFFSSEWLAERFNMDVVVLIRHPAAFISSIKKLNWPHPFSHFLEQPLLMKEHLYPFEVEIRDYANRELDIIDQGILLWKLIHHTIIKYQSLHKDWLFARHEDLSQDPVQSFQTIFNKLNLEFSDRVKCAVHDHSHSSHSIESEDPYCTKRNSQSIIWNWKGRLTIQEIERIRDKVEDISRVFYSNEDW